MAEIIHGRQYGIPLSANTAGRHRKSWRFEETSTEETNIRTNYAVWEFLTSGLFQQWNTLGTSLPVTPGMMYQSRLKCKLFL